MKVTFLRGKKDVVVRLGDEEKTTNLFELVLGVGMFSAAKIKEMFGEDPQFSVECELDAKEKGIVDSLIAEIKSQIAKA